MSQTETTQESKKEAAPKESFADTIVDISLSWADAGIGFSKTALENSARALTRTAKQLEVWQERLKANRAAAKDAVNKATEDAAPPQSPSA